MLGVNLRIATLEGELYMVKAHKQFILRCLRKMLLPMARLCCLHPVG